MGVIYALLQIVLAATSVMAASKRRIKEKDQKPKDPPVHLSMSYEDIKSDLVNFKHRDFAEVATGHRRIFVLFSSNKDPEGLRSLRGFYGAYQRLKQKDLNITWGMVDCDEDKPTCQNQEVHFAPQYWLYINKRRVNYTAGRSPYLVSDWLHKTIKYPGIFIDKRSDIKKYEAEQDRFFFYIGWMDTDYDFYREIAASYPFYLWISCFDRDRMMHANGIYWYEPPNNAQDMRNGPHGELVMMNFTLKYFNNMRYMSDWHLERIFVHERTAFFLVYPDTNEDRGIQMTFWPAAMDMKWSIVCWQVAVKIPEPDDRVIRLLEFLGVSNPHAPAVRLLSLKDGNWEIYQLKDRITTQGVLQFYDKFKKGLLTPFRKSASPVEHHGEGIRVVVAKNFQKYVMNEAHDVLVVFHKPNCTLSERLLKIGQAAQHLLSKHEQIRVVLVDGYMNDIGDDHPRLLPAVRLYSRHGKLAPQTFTGLFTAKDLVGWVSTALDIESPYAEEAKQRSAGSQPDI